MSRYAPKTPKLVMRYGKLPDDDPDIIIGWGPGCPKADGHLLFHYLCSPRPPALPLDREWSPALVDELKRRGYDLTTLRFSIERTKTAEAQ